MDSISKNDWLKYELVILCKKFGLKSHGNKELLKNRVNVFLETGSTEQFPGGRRVTSKSFNGTGYNK